jgi:nitrite reductase/ring-hydroxylating ferredoxin subunit
MNTNSKNKEPINRRSFLKRAWLWLGVIAGAEFLAVTFNMFSPRKSKSVIGTTTNIKTAGFVENISPGSVTPFKNGQFYLIRMEDRGFLAVSLACTHLGCSIGFDSSKQQFVCPCHSSVFDLKGNVLNPPAPRPLDTYRVFIEKGEVKIDTSRKIKRKRFIQEDVVYA